MTRPTEFSSASESSAVEAVQLWSVNHLAKETEESPLLRFVNRKHYRGIAIVESCCQVKTSESRLRRLSVE
jgi:hypothetical protein